MAAIITYLKESYDELMNKVTWPTWKELQSNTIIVVIASVIISLLIFVMDFGFGIVGDADSSWKGVLGFIYDMF